VCTTVSLKTIADLTFLSPLELIGKWPAHGSDAASCRLQLKLTIQAATYAL
jgi:hypothetical protein